MDRKWDDGVRVGLHPRVYIRLSQDLRVSQVRCICAITRLTMFNGIFNRVLVVINIELPRLGMERQEQVLLSAGLERVIHGDVRVIYQFIQRWALSMIILQARVQEGEALEGEATALREKVDATSDVLCQICLTSACKRSVASKHLVEDATKGPNIRRVVILVAVEHFRSHDERCAQPGCSQLTLLQLPGKTQVRDLDLERYRLFSAIGSNRDIFDKVLHREAWVEDLILGQMRKSHHDVVEFQVTMHAILRLDGHETLHKLL